jgi:hypothetical protein
MQENRTVHQLFIRTLIFVIVSLSLVSCSTSLRVHKELKVETKTHLQITEVSVTAADSIASSTSDTLLKALKSAVEARLLSFQEDDTSAVLEIVVTKARIVTRETRIFAGAFAGSSSLDITATIKDKKTGEALGIYEVTGSYNPGGLGAFSDPVEATANSVAEELIKGIYQ